MSGLLNICKLVAPALSQHLSLQFLAANLERKEALHRSKLMLQCEQLLMHASQDGKQMLYFPSLADRSAT